MKIINRIIILTFICIGLISCSSKSPEAVVLGTANITLNLSVADVENLNEETNLVFRMYDIKNKKWLEQNLDSKKNIDAKIENLDIAVFTNAQVAVSKNGIYDTRIYYGDIVVRIMNEEITLPHMDITIEGKAPEFLLTKIEDDIFYNKCYTCHNSVKKDAGLDLSKWNSYDNLVGVDAIKSKNSGLLIVPNNIKSSFCYQVLVHDDLLDMAYEKLTDAELKQLRQWINAGAPRY